MIMQRLAAAVSTALLASTLALACGGASPSCASTVTSAGDAAVFTQAQLAVAVLDRGGSSGGSSGGHSSGSSGGTHSSTGSSSSGRSGGTQSQAPSNSGTHTGGAPSNSGVHTPPAPAHSYTPPANSTFSSGGRSYPTSFGHSWTDSFGHVHVPHSHSYYHMGGYHDPFDPYDWTNFYNPASPWYGKHLHC